ncbi:MAG: NUDIX domain-containing protein [Propionibacteriaceae bacterium]|jgi:8-oxo-dGTP diphosphatase|nr:NUDIX domain-containing protein [Propionibacteriaceae bacterium]
MATVRPQRLIQAAGTVVLRPGASEPEVLLVHRKRYDDWSLPKGKLNPGEYLAECAVRETLEETSVAVRLGVPLDLVSYEVGDGLKSVSFWVAEAVRDDGHRPNDEVDKIRWLPVSKAVSKVSYPEDPLVIRQAIAMPATTPFLIARHGKAVPRGDWSAADPIRPLAERGHHQSKLLIDLFHAYGVRKLASSTSTRCIQTLEPYARAEDIRIEGWATLSEEDAEQEPAQVTALMERLVQHTARSGTPFAVCGHRPVLPLMLEAAGISARPLRPSAVMVAHLAADGSTVALEHHRPLL